MEHKRSNCGVKNASNLISRMVIEGMCTFLVGEGPSGLIYLFPGSKGPTCPLTYLLDFIFNTKRHFH